MLKSAKIAFENENINVNKLSFLQFYTALAKSKHLCFKRREN